MKPFMFVGPDVRGFKLVVFAPSRRVAATYVKNQALSSLAHRLLKFAGAGQPGEAHREGWVSACARG